MYKHVRWRQCECFNFLEVHRYLEHLCNPAHNDWSFAHYWKWSQNHKISPKSSDQTTILQKGMPRVMGLIEKCLLWHWMFKYVVKRSAWLQKSFRRGAITNTLISCSVISAYLQTKLEWDLSVWLVSTRRSDLLAFVHTADRVVAYYAPRYFLATDRHSCIQKSE